MFHVKSLIIVLQGVSHFPDHISACVGANIFYFNILDYSFLDVMYFLVLVDRRVGPYFEWKGFFKE